MKKTTFILFFLLSSICILSANTKVIENPSYEVKSTGIYNVSKIVLTDTSTRIYIHNTFIPHWWVQYNNDEIITDSKTGKTYKIIGIEGSEFGKKLWMPDSGDSTVVLIFPKLDDSVEKIDYGKNIYGISLKESNGLNKNKSNVQDQVTRWIDNKLAKGASKPPIDFNSPLFFNSDTAYLIGYLKGYDPRLGFSTGIIYTNNPITREDYPTVIQIYPDGRFEAKLPLNFPVYSYFVMNDQIFKFYLEPKQTLAVILNWDEFLTADRLRNIRYQFKNVTYKGSLSKINNELNGFSEAQYDYKEFQKKLATLSPLDFKKEQMTALHENLNKADAYIEKNKLSHQASILLKNQLLLANATRLFDFIDQWTYKARKDSANKFLKPSQPIDYYDFLKEIPLNDNSVLVLNEFSVFINRFEYCSPLMVFAKNNALRNFKPEKDFVTYIMDEKIDIAKNDMDLLILANKPEKSIEEMALLKSKQDTLMAFYFEKYKDIYRAYCEKYINPIINVSQTKTDLEQWRLKDSILVSVLGLKPNIVYDITKIRSLKFRLKNIKRESAVEYWDSLKTGIKHPYLIKTGDRVFNEVFPQTETASYELSPGTASDVFKKIISPFKGKILFVDFWATSCGPCLSNIKGMKSVREKYKDNPDFEFIFITDERLSPEETYKKVVEEQALKNTFRISSDDFYYLRQLFKFNGIPHYAAIDKNSRVISDDFEMDNFESELKKIVSKK